MTEQYIQKKIITYLESLDFFVINLIQTNKNGIPDLVAIRKDGTIFIEVKKKGGTVSKLQEFRIKELNQKGIRAIIAYSVEDVQSQFAQSQPPDNFRPLQDYSEPKDDYPF